MPLFRVNVRQKGPDEAEPAAAQGAAAPVGSAPRAAPRSDAAPVRGRSGVAALAVGAVFALVLMAGLSAALLRRSAGDSAGAADPAEPLPVSGKDSALPSAVEAASWNDTRIGPSSINPEFNLEQTIAYVNGIPIAMRDLDRAVRVARVLGDLSGEPVPGNDAPEFRDYQVKMLKRLVDLELMAQAVRTAGLLVPGGDTQEAVDAYVRETSTTAEQLAERMAAHSVTPAELDRWFRDGRTANFLVTQSLTVGKETLDRDQVTAEWLSTQWETQDIVINFYEPQG